MDANVKEESWKMSNEKFNPKVIVDLCIDSGMLPRECIEVIANSLAHMLKFYNGPLELRLLVLDAIYEGIKKAMIENGENE